MRFYSCRFAPNAETWHHAIRVGQRVIHHGEPVYESFAPQAFAGASEVPVLLDRDVMTRAGTVTVLVAHGDWHLADFVLDGPYASQAAEFIEDRARSLRASPGSTRTQSPPGNRVRQLVHPREAQRDLGSPA